MDKKFRYFMVFIWHVLLHIECSQFSHFMSDCSEKGFDGSIEIGHSTNIMVAISKKDTQTKIIITHKLLGKESILNAKLTAFFCRISDKKVTINHRK